MSLNDDEVLDALSWTNTWKNLWLNSVAPRQFLGKKNSQPHEIAFDTTINIYQFLTIGLTGGPSKNFPLAKVRGSTVLLS
jgi:hypothetical protein